MCSARGGEGRGRQRDRHRYRYNMYIGNTVGRYSQAHCLVGHAPGEPGEASPGTVDGGADAGAAGGAGGGGVDGWLCPGRDIVPRVDVV